MGKRARKGCPEEALQRQTARFLAVQYPEVVAWHTPNGGARREVEAARLKGQGVRAGVADWAILLGDGRVGFVELKTTVGRQSEAQVAFGEAVEAAGCPYRVVRSLGEFQELMREWLGARRWEGRGVLGGLTWGRCLVGLRELVRVYVDPQWYSEGDAALLEAAARTVRERVEAGKRERREANLSASGRG